MMIEDGAEKTPPARGFKIPESRSAKRVPKPIADFGLRILDWKGTEA